MTRTTRKDNARQAAWALKRANELLEGYPSTFAVIGDDDPGAQLIPVPVRDMLVFRFVLYNIARMREFRGPPRGDTDMFVNWVNLELLIRDPHTGVRPSRRRAIAIIADRYKLSELKTASVRRRFYTRHRKVKLRKLAVKQTPP